jgi:hypothetical protein
MILAVGRGRAARVCPYQVGTLSVGLYLVWPNHELRTATGSAVFRVLSVAGPRHAMKQAGRLSKESGGRYPCPEGRENVAAASAPMRPLDSGLSDGASSACACDRCATLNAASGTGQLPTRRLNPMRPEKDLPRHHLVVAQRAIVRRAEYVFDRDTVLREREQHTAIEHF